MPDLATFVISCGDYVDIPRRYLRDAAVDLVFYPPFSSSGECAK